MGKIHLRLLKESARYELVGFYDPDEIQGRKVSQEFGIPYFDNMNRLIEAVDMVDVVTPTLSHYDCARKAIQAGKHVFIEKPVTHTHAEALELMELVDRYGLAVHR